MTETHLVHTPGAQPAMDSKINLHDSFSTQQMTAPLRRLGGALVTFLAGMADGFRAYRRWQRLVLMSDADLARMGLDRRGIAQHAMFGRPEGPDRQ